MNTAPMQRTIARILIAAVLTGCCGISELAEAQASQPPAPAVQVPAQNTPAQDTPAQDTPAQDTQQPATSPDTSTTPAPSAQTAPQSQTAPGGVVDPSAGPLAPVPSNQPELPSAPSSSRQSETPAQAAPSAQQSPTFQQPVGAAGAQIGPTAGGAASKPAGNAIAPAKQHETRSFLIKMGAVAAAGVAIGTVLALSRGTSSKPPGAR